MIEFSKITYLPGLAGSFNGFSAAQTQDEIMEDGITYALNLYRLQTHPTERWFLTRVNFDKIVEKAVEFANDVGSGYEYPEFTKMRAFAFLFNRGYSPEAAPGGYIDPDNGGYLPLDHSGAIPPPYDPHGGSEALQRASSAALPLWIIGLLLLYLLSRRSPQKKKRGKKKQKANLAGLDDKPGLSGATGNCVAWQEVPGPKGGLVWRCASYAAPCAPQSKCKPKKLTHKFQRKTCVQTQRVKTNSPKFKGTTLTRCKKYAPVCNTLCFPEKATKPDPSPAHGLDINRMARELAQDMADQYNDSLGIRKSFGREILERGGLKPSYAYAEQGRLKTAKRQTHEEFAVVPIFLRRKDGLPIDEMAAEMGFPDDNAFLRAIEKEYPKGKKKEQYYSWRDFVEQAEGQIWSDIESGMFLGATGLSGKGDFWEDLPRTLTLKSEDIATSDDPLEIFLQRKGWDMKRVRELQASMAEKAVPDMFTMKTTPLSAGEKELQRNIEEFTQKQAAIRKKASKKEKTVKPVKLEPGQLYLRKTPQQAMLFGVR